MAKSPIPENELADVLKNPRLSILHAESFLLLFVFYIILAPVYTLSLESVKIAGLGMSFADIDPYFTLGMKFILTIAIIVTTLRIFAAFWMLEHDIAFKVLLQVDSPRKEKVSDLTCRAFVTISTMLVIVCLWRGWPVEICFIFASGISWRWDNIMLKTVRNHNKTSAYEECENFKNNLETWRKFDKYFFFAFLIELFIAHFANAFGFVDASPFGWLFILGLFTIIILILEYREVTHLKSSYKGLWNIIKTEFSN